jgi:hypothetical protein
MLGVLLLCPGVNQNIIDENNDELIKELSEHSVH